MSMNQPPVPDLLPTAWRTPPNLKELTLALYRHLANCSASVEASKKHATEQVEDHIRQTSRIIAQLAAQRFEYERLLKRVLPELEVAGLREVGDVLLLFARSWDAELRSACVEVRDLTGQMVTDDLTDMIEVHSAVSESGAESVLIRETLFPLVMYRDVVVGPAHVITSVPPQSGDTDLKEA